MFEFEDEITVGEFQGFDELLFEECVCGFLIFLLLFVIPQCNGGIPFSCT